ncbi:MAG: DUF2922 domain-containing protein [Paraclostridium sp.]
MANLIKKRLVMTFKDAMEDRVSLSVDEPRADVTEQEIKDVMDVVLLKNLFHNDGVSLVSSVEAKVVVTDTTEYDLIIG